MAQPAAARTLSRTVLPRPVVPVTARSMSTLPRLYRARTGLRPRVPLCNRFELGRCRGFHSSLSCQSAEGELVTEAATGETGTSSNTASKPPAPRRITIEDIYARRKRDGRLVAGTAAAADIDSFKTASDWQLLPKARRWDHLLSSESRARGPCVLKQAAQHLKKPGMISLGGGLPTPEHFPIQSLSLRVPTGPTDFSETAAGSEDGGATVTMGKYDASLRAGSGGEPAAEYDLSVALNYGQAAGSPQMLRGVTEHTELVCRPPYADWRTTLTVGSTGALEQALRIFCERERGDTLLTEVYSFATALETAWPLGIHVQGVDIDGEGMRPDSLDALLSGWDVQARGGRRKPHLLYTVPSGQNPTGTTQSLERRQALYDVCRRHDVFILEDEPYYFLQMPPYVRSRDAAAAPGPGDGQTPPSAEAFLQSLIPTMVSLDVDGRVMRLDSFSKVLVPGSRMGWVTASEQVVERYVRHSEVCSQGAAGISQAVLYQLLETTWGHAGYLNWLAHLQRSYTRRRNVMLDACEDYLPTGIVTWKVPVAGMFHWLKVDHTQHPDHGRRDALELEDEIFKLCIDKGVLVARGSWFSAEPDKPQTGLFFRTTFAAAPPDAIVEAIRRFGEAVKRSFRL
ncbi:aromatic aminotransferase [Grosmannia clavigera kw1407]|uniref:aromatic-amino-acid transaminase n=1 Tax=Grosmannia clavigera (strain kw1407 / UAMH 11150) TaxID=655863 RepID=F0XHG5_GROCL|nr:aromatic aminotransferase [Grosmannia clavigera kw1407]EFX02649.1 aromatic aminotransferase [Grosmannia clavigera kw1407]